MALDRDSVNSGTTWEVLASYSRAIRIDNRILVSGTTATGPDGLVGGDDPAAQAHFILDKIEAAITELGGSMRDVIRTRIYLRNVSDWEPVSRVHGERFARIRPANTLVEAKLVGDEYLVEIEAEAVIGAGDAL
ncbi:MAG: RidA family protein [Chloroflexota bacterium]